MPGPIEIDLERVERLLIFGCKGSEIAAAIGVHPDTLYRRIVDECGINFSTFAAQKKEKGDTLLKEAQFLKAIDGDNTMLIWLGKHRLGQTEGEDPKHISKEKEQELTKQLALLMTENENLKKELDALKPQTSPIDSGSEPAL
jgi:hypothetical protein